MKRIIVLVVLFCGVCSAYSQITQKMYDEKVEENFALKDSIKNLQKTVNAEKESRKQMEMIDAQIKTKSDSIILLKTQLLDKDQQIASAKQEGGQEALADIVNSYKNEPFDDLIKSSTKKSVTRDLQVLGSNAEVRRVLNDLHVYFDARELLSKKFDAVQVKTTLSQLDSIKQESALLDKLDETFDKYQIFNDGLKETIKKIAELDRKETVTGMSDEIQKMKFNKILAELSPYIFNYDFNFVDYPYLSDIVLEIIKRKYPDADANIEDLLQKL